MSFSKPIVEPSPTMYQSDPRQMGSGCKKYNPQRSFKESDTTAVPPPLSFQELDEEISKYKCSSHNKACSVGRGGCFGNLFRYGGACNADGYFTVVIPGEGSEIEQE